MSNSNIPEPCPNCGKHVTADEFTDGSCVIQCDNCGVFVVKDTVSNAIKSWNNLRKIKKCPFCGAKQKKSIDERAFPMSPKMNIVHVGCEICGATSGGVYVEEVTDKDTALGLTSKEQTVVLYAAIEDWNLRAGDSRKW